MITEHTITRIVDGVRTQVGKLVRCTARRSIGMWDASI